MPGETALFHKILIANRGEIAVRIAGTCRELGIRSVAVYSTADQTALHTQIADEAYEIGPAPALESYLNIEAILRVARETGADAIHPGYGFLAENAVFAQAVIDAGLAWIGPPATVITRLGDKVAAKRLAAECGVEGVPGYSGGDQSASRLAGEAERIGYPVMLKAAAGGGGRGMRSVAAAGELGAALESAQREARAAFGDDRIFIEKKILAPRHIEFQVFIDSSGAGVYLGERDCSLQRRHQKVVEEAPSSVLTPELRARMGDDALRLMLAAGYRNAGTVEFLLDGERYYFLEVNTRIQVEHPVTEMVTGLDLIRLQIEIAAGRALGMTQAQVQLRGHAIEARLYAEDPATDFLPSTGRLSIFRPPQGPGIRNDVGVYQGFTVSPYYDPMLAKLIVHADTREAALVRLQSALAEYGVVGPKNNIAFLSWVTSREEFAAGAVDVEFIDRTWSEAELNGPEAPMGVIAAAALNVVAPVARSHMTDLSHSDPFLIPTVWRPFGSHRRLLLASGDRHYAVELTANEDNAWVVRCGERSLQTTLLPGRPDEVVMRSAGENDRYEVRLNGTSLEVTGRAGRYLLRLIDLDDHHVSVKKGEGGNRALAPMPGTVVKIAVKVGQRVRPHESLVVLEAMKMEHVIEAPRAGRVSAVLVAVGDLVAAGAEVVELSEL